MKYFFLLFSFALCGSAFAQPTIGLTEYTEPNTDGYLLFAPIASTQTYLIDKCGRKVKEWTSSRKAGLSAYLLPNGNLFRTGLSNSAYFGTGGGKGGVLQKFDWDGTLLWEYSISDSLQCQHHDAVVLPNGNVLAIVWDLKTSAEAIANGKNPAVMSGITAGVLWSEKIVEIQPSGASGGTVVWEWKVFDHLVQDFDNSKSNFGVVADHPELIDLNYTSGPAASADWIHFNSIDYNAATDQILLSTHNLEEIWIIDHSTSTAEAASHSGGNAGRGGDLLYRWGNPQVYDRGNATDKKLYKQHHANWIPTGYPNAGKILIFNNGLNRPGGNSSSVDMIETPIDANNLYPLAVGANYAPSSLFWTYQSLVPSNFYASNISGAFALKNGSFMITNGPIGQAFEIDSAGGIFWQYVNPVTAAGPQTQGSTPVNNTVFRYNFYEPDYAAFSGQTLVAGDEIELNPTNPSICVMTGISEVETNSLLAYPNPANTELTIEWADGRFLGELQLINSLGQTVYFSNQDAVSLLQIPLTDFSNGLYFLQVGNYSQKIVILH